jgi:hypothetical protein
LRGAQEPASTVGRRCFRSNRGTRIAPKPVLGGAHSDHRPRRPSHDLIDMAPGRTHTPRPKARCVQSSPFWLPSGGSPCVSPTCRSSCWHPCPWHPRKRQRRRSISISSRRAFSRSFSPSVPVTRAALRVTVQGRRCGSSRWRLGERPGLTRSRARTSMQSGGW